MPGWSHLKPEDSSDIPLTPRGYDELAVSQPPPDQPHAAAPPNPAPSSGATLPAASVPGSDVPHAQPAPRAQPPAGSIAQPRAEEVFYDGRGRHSAFIGGYLKWLMVSAVAGAVSFGLTQLEFFAGWPMWVLSLIGLPGMLWVFLTFRTTRYKISTRRVEFERGVLSTDVDSLELWRVLDVKYKRTLIDRLLGTGRVILIGTDQTDPELMLYGLPQARRLFEQLRDAVQAARHTSRPMEMVGHDGMMEQLSNPHVPSL